MRLSLSRIQERLRRAPRRSGPRAGAGRGPHFGLRAAPLGPANPSSTVSLENPQGGRSGEADVYAWGLKGESQDLGSADLRAVGVQSFDTARGKLLVFAVNTWKRWSSASTDEFDIFVDINGDGIPDYLVVGVDFGFLTDAFNSSISQAQDVVVAPDGTASFAVSIDPAEFARTPALGLMVVTLDNKSGPKQAQLLPVTNQAAAAPAPRPCRWGRGCRRGRGRTRRPPRGWLPRARAARAG
jgi:hypothetical protein